MKTNNIKNSSFILLLLAIIVCSLDVYSQQKSINKSPYRDIYMWYPNPADVQTKNINICCNYIKRKNVLKVNFKNICQDTLVIVNYMSFNHPTILRLYTIDNKNDTVYYMSYSYSNNTDPTILLPEKKFVMEYNLNYDGVDFQNIQKLNIKHLVHYLVLPSSKKNEDNWKNFVCDYAKEENITVNKKHK